jgi:sugar (pentulose or hexulose) kinase
MPTPVIAVFDIGKTNKKLILFNEEYDLVFEKSIHLQETTDEDSEPCENIDLLTEWVLEILNEVLTLPEYDIKAINFSTYGASFVYVDNEGKPLTPLYNYLKKYPETLSKQFYSVYGGEENISLETASPALGSLNSGLQVYRLKYFQPAIFNQVALAFHLPQYLSYLISKYPSTDITSIGCHTALWDFQKNKYHAWVEKEGLDKIFAPVFSSSTTTSVVRSDRQMQVGIGLHDSSAALIPYLISFPDPFILISTGTWCISLNPFNNEPLTKYQLENDCLCYMSFYNKPVKASRLFAGYEHEQTIKKLAAHFNVNEEYYQTIKFNASFVDVNDITSSPGDIKTGVHSSAFAGRDLNDFKNYEEAYHCFIADIIQQQKVSLQFVLSSNIKQIFVDGGFSKNIIYMSLLATAFPHLEINAASLPQSTAKGAALAIHESWNSKSLSKDLISLERANPL